MQISFYTVFDDKTKFNILKTFNVDDLKPDSYRLL